MYTWGEHNVKAELPSSNCVGIGAFKDVGERSSGNNFEELIVN